MSAPTTTTISAFLRHAKSALQKFKQSKSSPSPLTFILGNESADLDSVCSAVVYAYLRTQYSTRAQSRSGSGDDGGVCIPVTNIPSSDLPLRTELTSLLRRVGITPSELITLNDLPDFTPSKIADCTRWLLVDQNAVQNPLRQVVTDRVVGCIDHHDEEHFVPEETGVEPRIVARSGSCTSLIIEHCRDGWDANACLDDDDGGGRGDRDVYRNVAMLALAPILIDTTNLMAKDKTLDVDRESVRYLESRISDKSFDRTAFFEALQTAKADLDVLSMQDILRKDYKSWTQGGLSLGISSIMRPFDYLIDRSLSAAHFLDEIDHFARERHLAIIAVMTTTTTSGGKFCRELLTWGLTQQGTRIVRRFQRSASEELKLEKWGEGVLDLEGDRTAEGISEMERAGRIEQVAVRRCWKQGNVEASRKRVGPLLREVMGEVEEERR